MMKKKWIPLCMLLMGFVFPVSAAPITHVQVTVKTAQYTLPSIVQARIGASIQTVGNHVLLLSLIHISEPTRQDRPSRMPSSA